MEIHFEVTINRLAAGLQKKMNNFINDSPVLNFIVFNILFGYQGFVVGIPV